MDCMQSQAQSRDETRLLGQKSIARLIARRTSYLRPRWPGNAQPPRRIQESGPEKGTKAPQGRGEKIHTNSENAFITAEVMKFQDFKEEGSESAVKTTVEDGDVISANSVCQEKKSESNSWRERDKRRSDNRRRTRFLLRILVGSNPSPCQGAGSLNSDSFAI
ncbi:uncharacterized protein LOC144060919 isoform X3 [Vanacampus margaritifer]